MTSPASSAAGKALDRGSVSNDRYITEGQIRVRIGNKTLFPIAPLSRSSDPLISLSTWVACCGAYYMGLLGQFRQPLAGVVVKQWQILRPEKVSFQSARTPTRIFNDELSMRQHSRLSLFLLSSLYKMSSSPGAECCSLFFS